MPLTHKELRECMRVLGYQFDGGGSCFGVANMGKQALLTGEMEVFNKRLIRIKEVLLPLIRQQHQLLYKSRLSGMKETDVVPINEKQLVSYKDWSDVYAFFDGVNAYQSPRIYANLFETGRQLTQDSRPISPVITPIVLEDQGIVTLPSFSGAYDALSLKTYFLCLDEAFSNLPYSVSLDISLADHQISCLYDSKAKKWTLLDVDFLEYADKSFSADEIAKLIIKEYGPHLIFSDTPSVIAKDQDHLTAVFTALDQNPQWIDIH